MATETFSSWRTLSLSPYETRLHLSYFLSLVGVFAVITSWYRTKERLDRLLTVAVFSGFALSVVGILQKLTWNGKILWFRPVVYENIFGPFVNRNNYAAFAGTVLPLALCMALSAFRQVERRRPGALPRLLLWTFATVAMISGIFLSLSRGGIVCAILSLVVVALMLLYYGRASRELAALSAMAIVAAVALFLLGPEKVIERVGTLSQGQRTHSMEDRIGVWRRSRSLIADSPLVGTGLGAFKFSFMRFSPPGESWSNEADDEYIEMICDTGIVGGLLALGAVLSWIALIGRPASFRDRPERYPYMGIIAGIAGMLVHAAVSPNLQMPADGLILTVMCAALIVLAPGPAGRRRQTVGAGARPPQPAAASPEEVLT